MILQIFCYCIDSIQNSVTVSSGANLSVELHGEVDVFVVVSNFSLNIDLEPAII